jgi:hypothetical protein
VVAREAKPTATLAMAASSAITIENSPRATSVAPARTWPRILMPARRAAHAPLAVLVTTVTAANATAGPITAGIACGSVCSPKNTKNTAAKRSRSGESNCWALSDTRPDRAMPMRKAPTASETCSPCAMPATSSVMPSTESSRTSLCSE